MSRTITNGMDPESGRLPRPGKTWPLPLALLLASLAPSPAMAGGAGSGNPNPGVLPPQSHPFGASYGVWSARWWQWALSLSASEHPLLDTGDCSVGQTGHVWFLGGIFGVGGGSEVIGVAERDCTIPSGTALLFPIGNFVCSQIADPSQDETELRDCAVSSMNHFTTMEATIDGVPVQALDRYRVQSPSIFTLGPLPEDPVPGFEQGAIGDSYADGVFLMLAPLSAGEHTVLFSATLEFTEEEDGFDFFFSLDVTYHITVAPGGACEQCQRGAAARPGHQATRPGA